MSLTNLFRVQGDWQICLISSSPRRQEMLSNLGLEYLSLKPTNLELPPLPNESPTAYAKRMAKEKLESRSSQQSKDQVLISADTIVYQGKKIFGKPKDTEEAEVILNSLNGKAHQVMTATLIKIIGYEPRYICGKSQVVFAHWPQRVLEAYIHTGEGMDKAGAYGIQGLGRFLIKEINGSVTNIIGLPLTGVLKYLMSKGIIGVN